ncbi:hypothetical protein FB004_107297 [Sinorhizobium medicae]|nr:hypothetical protein FB004_107297 [Sinorhizobium medicae]
MVIERAVLVRVHYPKRSHRDGSGQWGSGRRSAKYSTGACATLVKRAEMPNSFIVALITGMDWGFI